LAESEAQDFITLMKDLVGDTTILLIEHNMQVVMQTADLVTVMDQGEILAQGTPEEIHADVRVQAAYLGTVDA
jgi:branched-chain amino acid transport system ATP-binding protein